MITIILVTQTLYPLFLYSLYFKERLFRKVMSTIIGVSCLMKNENTAFVITMILLNMQSNKMESTKTVSHKILSSVLFKLQ